MTSAAPLLSLHKVQARYGPVAALREVSLELRQGQITALIGANGAGKSTTLLCVSRIHDICGGEMLYEGQSLLGLSPAQVVERGLIHVPEGRRVFPRMTVLENLRMGAFLVRDATTRKFRQDRVFSIFPRLFERQHQKAGTLSGGEQQMLALGRALMAGPKVLLLDEPSLGLAPIIVQRIFEVLVKLNEEGCTLLLVEQNAHMALEISHHAYVLESGATTLQGPACELAQDPRVIEKYLGG